MRLLTFAARATPGEARVGAMLDGRVLDLRSLEPVLAARRGERAVIPGSMKGLLKLEEAGRRRVADLLDFARAEPAAVPSGALLSEADIIFLPPVMDADKFLCVGKRRRYPQGEGHGVCRRADAAQRSYVPRPPGA